MRWIFWIACLLAASPSLAQESQLHAEFRAEGERLKENCTAGGLSKIGSCAMTIVTDRPLHFAFGSIAPQNGFGMGAAFVTHHTPNERWRVNLNADGVAAPGGAWRAGGYLKIIHTPVEAPTVLPGSAAGPAPPAAAIRQYAVLDVYGQTISLPKLLFFGLGPSTARADKSIFGLRETVVGTKALSPVTRFPTIRQLNLSIAGEVNGRFVRVHGDDSRSDSFVQFGEGLRIAPAMSSGVIRLNYQIDFQQFLAMSDATYSFRRWTADLGHEIALYHTPLPRGPRETNGPNDCSMGPAADRCPPVSRNRTGTISARLLLSRSAAGDRGTVPFYFQRTLGGSDINGNASLAAYEDYRFRGPHLILLQESFEHSIYGPVGVWVAADQGRVALQAGGFPGLRNLVRTIAAGVSLRAGGFPAVVVSYAKGSEGYHFAATISPSLLGGSTRPSLH